MTDTAINPTSTPSGDKTGAGDRGGNKGLAIPQVPLLSLPRETRTHYTPWLVVRDALGDMGDRPLPGGAVFWESPDVWVVSSLGVNEPVPGQNNTVFARVTNLGLQDATGVFVKFWWANPSLAITEANAHLIGTGFCNIPSGSTTVVQCPKPWIPVVENNGHECLLAEAFIPNFDPLTAPMDPVDDRHVGQKNEQLVVGSPGQMFRVGLEALNITPFALPVRFEVASLLRQKKAPALLAARPQLATFKLRPPAAALPLLLKVDDEPSAFAPVSATFARRLLSATLLEEKGAASLCGPPPQIAHTATFAPWETRGVEVSGRVPADAQPGESFQFRVTQRIGHLITGGYTVHVVVR